MVMAAVIVVWRCLVYFLLHVQTFFHLFFGRTVELSNRKMYQNFHLGSLRKTAVIKRKLGIFIASNFSWEAIKSVGVNAVS